ncbi:uncharacterized protein MELLADRAFT_88990 [Melampsora larici-populina 98AG31]|uniref:deoxyhypusine synthase n=1 Tax=Melampsora larici-populina (strain 98AG31 / pathotype 3-4-7) TaxID=747676 RepID=F4R6J2_MELLP|nr:uncharacterized protein MELLADRAFT_88990 [Melampsora larici-populina 98AG31]EGG12455.1 hypothetical protein MELLADRAFT_88990 [Melampsora larici-populina 98AG31]
MSSGLQEILEFSTELSYISLIVLTAGGIQDDIVKCVGPTYLSSFDSNSRSNPHRSGSIYGSRRSPKIASTIILGDGKNGVEYALYVNLGQELDGSDSGVGPNEAISWGKFKMDSDSVQVLAVATLVSPLFVAATWRK